MQCRFLSFQPGWAVDGTTHGQTSVKFVLQGCHVSDMAPSTQLKEAVADVKEGIRAILLGPPGAGKGTQVSCGQSLALASSDWDFRRMAVSRPGEANANTNQLLEHFF